MPSTALGRKIQLFIWPTKPFMDWWGDFSRLISFTAHCLTACNTVVQVFLTCIHWFIQSFSKVLSGVCFPPSIFLHSREKVNKTDVVYTYLEYIISCMSIKGWALSKDMHIEYLRWITVLWRMLLCIVITEPSLIMWCLVRDIKETREHLLCFSCI